MSRRPRKLASLIGACALVAGGLLVLSPTSGGALTQIVVATNADAGAGSLRQAFIDASNGGTADGDDVEIVIPASVGNITLTTGQLAYDGGDNGARSLTLRGSGTTITQTTANNRVIQLNGGTNFDLVGLTITGGVAPAGQEGGAIQSGGGTGIGIFDSTITGNSAPGSGGGIHMFGNLGITNSTISGNSTPGAAGGAFAAGTMVVSGSTVTGNTAVGPGGGLLTNGPARITNSTVTGNTAGQGGGVYAQGNVSLVYATVVENTAPQGANFDFNPTALTLTGFGSVVARPLGGGTNCSNQGTTSSQGYNFEDANSCGFGAGAGDQTNAGNPQLAALNNNGGPTATMAPSASSGLVDKIPASSPCGGVNITVDQRGLPRPVTAGQFCDIGAYEIQVAALQSDRLTFTG